MTLASPLWLLGLVPWVGVVVWLLSGKHQHTTVPFLNLWRGVESSPRVRAAIRLPPLALVCLLLAMLLGIIAASQPRVTLIPYTIGPDATIIVDRGVTMSACGEHGPMYQEAAQAARQPIVREFGFGPTELVLVPGPPPIRTDRLDWYLLIDQNPPPPTDTHALLPAAVMRALAEGERPVVVISNQKLPIEQNPRLIQITPSRRPRNIGIVRAAVRRIPTTQVMVRLLNDSDFTTALLKLAGDGRDSIQSIPLPPAGQEKDYFFDPPPINGRLTVELTTEDDIAIDNRVTLVAKPSWPAVRTAGQLPEELGRIIDSYTRLRPAAAGAQGVLVTSEPAPENVPAAIVAPAPEERVAAGSIDVKDHPINASIDWPSSLGGELSIAPAPQGDWRAVVSAAGGRPIVAVREAPARQVWVGFRSDSLPRTPQFVIFWANVLDWISGEGGESFESQGTPAVRIEPAVSSDWQSKMHALPPRLRKGIDLAPGLLITGVGLVMAGLLAWGRRATHDLPCHACKNCASR